MASASSCSPVNRLRRSSWSRPPSTIGGSRSAISGSWRLVVLLAGQLVEHLGVVELLAPARRRSPRSSRTLAYSPVERLGGVGVVPQVGPAHLGLQLGQPVARLADAQVPLGLAEPAAQLAQVVGEVTHAGSAALRLAPWHSLNFLPDPHGHGALRGVFAHSSLTTVSCLAAGCPGGGAGRLAMAARRTAQHSAGAATGGRPLERRSLLGRRTTTSRRFWIAGAAWRATACGAARAAAAGGRPATSPTAPSSSTPLGCRPALGRAGRLRDRGRLPVPGPGRPGRASRSARSPGRCPSSSSRTSRSPRAATRSAGPSGPSPGG